MVRSNEFAEAVSAIFAIVVFIMIAGVLLQSLSEFSSALGNLTWVILILIIITFIFVLIKIIDVIKDLFD